MNSQVTIALLLVASCHQPAELERLEVGAVHRFDRAPFVQAAPPPPPPPPPRSIPPPPEIAALVRDRFGAPQVTLREQVDGKLIRLELREAVKLVGLLAGDTAFIDAMNGCSCGPLTVAIARHDTRGEFVVDCANVYTTDGRFLASLAGDVSTYLDSLR